jgi:hypothetical protein
MLGVKVTEAPAHVPKELVLDYPIKMGGLTDENPFDQLIPNIHRTMPPIFYSLDAYPGGTPAWRRFILIQIASPTRILHPLHS